MILLNLKALESQIKRLKFDYLYIDNAQLTSPYLMGSNGVCSKEYTPIATLEC